MGDYAQHLVVKERRIAQLRSALTHAFAPGTKILLELGCGHGHWLAAYAEAHPEQACLGVDLLAYRIRKAAHKKEKRTLANLHFLKGEARELLTAWPADRHLSEVFMLFPDPWPKARHHKHRMIQQPFLDALRDLTEPGARFYFRTDHTGYFQWTKDHFEAHPSWSITSSAPWPWETESFFQGLMDSWQSLVAERIVASPHLE